MTENELKNITESLIETFKIAGEKSIKLYNEGLDIKIKDDFMVTDADILPHGLLLILERRFSWTQGFKTRFRLISLDKFDNTEPIIVLSLIHI